MEKFCSDQAFLGVTADADYLRLENWHLSGDGTVVRIRLSAASTRFVIRDFVFEADPKRLAAFTAAVKKLYAELTGAASLAGLDESGAIRISAGRGGHCRVYCDLQTDHPVPQQVHIGFEIDQSYFPGFITALETVLDKLGLPPA
jgi:hypothetical protein